MSQLILFNTIKVLTVIDCETLLELYTNPSTSMSNPTSISQTNLNKTIYTVTKDIDTMTGKPGSELNIRTDVQDKDILNLIKWRVTSLSLDTDLEAEFYEVRAINCSESLIYPPRKVESGQSSYWLSIFIGSGKVIYDWKLKISDRFGNILGCLSSQ